MLSPVLPQPSHSSCRHTLRAHAGTQCSRHSIRRQQLCAPAGVRVDPTCCACIPQQQLLARACAVQETRRPSAALVWLFCAAALCCCCMLCVQVVIQLSLSWLWCGCSCCCCCVPCVQVRLPRLWPRHGRLCGADSCRPLPHDHTLHQEQKDVCTQARADGALPQGG